MNNRTEKYRKLLALSQHRLEKKWVCQWQA